MGELSLLLTAIGVGATIGFGIAALIIALRNRAASPEQVEQLKREVKNLREAFNSWRTVPSDERLRRLLAERSRREHLAKAAELAKANQHQEAIKHLEACLTPELAAANRASIYNLIGNAHMAIPQLIQAEAAYRNCLAAAGDIADPKGKKEAQAAALGNLGLVFFQKGDLEKALEHLQQALQIDRQIGDRLGEANQLGNLGVVFRQKGDLDKAQGHLQQALEIYREIGHRLGEAQDLGNLGNVYLQKDELEKAREHYQAALSLFRAIGAQREIALMEKNIALAEQEKAKQGEKG